MKKIHQLLKNSIKAFNVSSSFFKKKNQTKILLFAILFLCLPTLVIAQSPAITPTLIGQYIYSAKGNGNAGIPNFTWNIPAGKNRIMIVNTFFEREQNPLTAIANNWPVNTHGDNLNINVGGKTLNYLTATSIYAAVSYSQTTSDANIINTMSPYYLSDAQGLPTGNTAFSFPSMAGKPPKSVGDEAIISIMVFENVSQSAPFVYNKNLEFISNNPSYTSLHGRIPPIPAGTTNNNIVYLATGTLSKESILTYSSPYTWTNLHSSSNSNFAGQSFPELAEPSGSSLTTIYTSAINGAPTISFSRSDANQILGYMGQVLAIVPVAYPRVTGTIFNDINGPANIDGLSSGGDGLFINVYSSTNQFVISAPVDGTGSFIVPGGNLMQGETYNLKLSKNQASTGNPYPSQQLNTNWTTVGESLSTSGNDGFADGVLTVTMSDVNLNGVRFGINNPSVVVTPPTTTGPCSGDLVNIKRSGTLVVNGVTISYNAFGSADDLIKWPVGSTSTSCGIVTDHHAALLGGSSIAASNRSLVFGFDKPVNDLIFVATSFNDNERLKLDIISQDQVGTPFPVSSSDITITPLQSCFTSISGNIINSSVGGPTVVETTGPGGVVTRTGGGGGIYRVHSETPMARLIVNFDGSTNSGIHFSFCESSIVPVGTPVISSITPATQSLCSGVAPSPISVSATGTGPFSYQWFSNTTNSNTGGSPVGTNSSTYTPPTSFTSGNTYYYVIVSNSSSSAISSTVSVTTTALATPTISANGSINLCGGGNVTLSSSAASGNQWYLNGSQIFGATAPDYVASTAGNYTVIVSLNSCTSNVSNAIPVTTGTTPPPPNITVAGSTVLCSGSNATLTSSVASGNQWYRDGNPIAGANNQTYVTSVAGSYTATVTSGSCTSIASNSILLTTGTTPPKPTVTASGNTALCGSANVTLTSSSTSGNQWYLSGNAIVGAVNQTYVASTAGDYTVITTAITGCPSVASNATTVTIGTPPAQPIITAGGPTLLCGGSTVTLTSSVASGNQWYLDGNPIAGATNQTYIASTAGNYTATVGSAGCTSNPSNIIAVTTGTTPLTPGVTAGGNTALCGNESVTLSSSATTGNQWYLNGNAIVGAVNQTYVASTAGSYTVIVTNLAGCASAVSNTVVVTSSSSTNPPILGIPDSYTQTSFSTFEGFANGWPNNIPNGFIAIESKNKGFVITRVESSTKITEPIEGMLIYDITDKCIKLYNGTVWKCLEKSCN